MTELRQLADQLQREGIVASQMPSGESIRQACSDKGIARFVDAEFFPDDSALFKSQGNQSVVVWRRASDFLKHGKIELFQDGIKASDIHQGSLGNCWFMAAVAAIAEFPDLVEDIFCANKTSNELGVYELTCFKDGQRTTVIVDDLFPCSLDTECTKYAHAVGNELWVILLEKAWAKLHGSYERLVGGRPEDAIMDLIGAPGERFNVCRDPHPCPLFSELCGWDEQGFIMSASTPGKDDMTGTDKKRPEFGLVPGHAYTLISAKEAKNQRLVKLRNPWGKFEWGGAWGDKSNEWKQPGMKDAFNPRLDSGDGEFWMCEKDFRERFEEVSVNYICRSQPPRWHQLLTSGSSWCSSVLEFDVAQGAVGVVALCQQDTRRVGVPEYVEIGFAVYGPCDDQGLPEKEVLRSEFSSSRCVIGKIAAALKPGKYLVAVFAAWGVTSRPLSLLMQLNGSSVCSNCTVAHDFEALQDAIAECSAREELLKAEAKEHYKTASFFMCGAAFFVACATSGKTLALDLDFSESAGVELREGGLKRASPLVLPSDGSPQVVPLIVVDAACLSLGYSFSWKAVK